MMRGWQTRPCWLQPTIRFAVLKERLAALAPEEASIPDELIADLEALEDVTQAQREELAQPLTQTQREKLTAVLTPFCSAVGDEQ